ncbi:MAG: methyltransferase domain-containing protein [Cyclobacteriaceae bacterium]
MQGYEEIFSKRGKSYHAAMAQFPRARDEEFETATGYLNNKPTSILLDIPAGGGYLKKYIDRDIQYLAYDFSGEFDDNHTGVAKCREAKIDLHSESVDEIISLAALHHVVDKVGFFKEMFRVLKPGGQFVIGDVVEESRIASFLNGFLDKWNSMGHNGSFINADTDISLLNQCGFSTSFELKSFHWSFANEAESLEFFRKLFYLDLNPSDDLLMREIESLGVLRTKNGYCVEWSLGFLKAEKDQ